MGFTINASFYIMFSLFVEHNDTKEFLANWKDMQTENVKSETGIFTADQLNMLLFKTESIS